MKQAVIVICVALIGSTIGHSWIACTDYLQENGDYWSSAYCRSYARHGHQYTPKDNFGIDRGYNYNNVVNHKACFSAKDDAGAYSKEYPMGVYYPGQKVVLAHPVKNHVAETCTNKYIPDHGNFVYISGKNPAKDPTLAEFKQNMIADFGTAPFGHERTQAEITTYPKPGYQNAPKFCENMDKALATNAFYVPNLQPGRYTFMWEWNFNSKGAGDTYTSCWEADVMTDKAARDSVLKQRNFPTREPELLHGKSLAPPMKGAPVQPKPQPKQTTMRPVRPTSGRPGRPTQPQRQTNNGQTSNAPAYSQRLQCVDSCLSQCYRP